MKQLGVLVVAVGMLVATVGGAAEHEEATESAVTSAKAWLALVDSGDYGESWKQAADYFKGAVSEDQWRQAMHGVRAPLGEVVSRKLKSATYTAEVPGAPDGEYVIIQFDTTFANKKGSVETVTPMRQQDGAWRVSGYFIK
jgi:hypothetical protein